MVTMANKTKTPYSEILSLRKEYEAENELLKELKKKPISEGQLKDMISRGRSELDSALITKRLGNTFDTLRERGMITPNEPISFEQFKDDNPGAVCIQASTFQQMETSEYQAFTDYFKRQNRNNLNTMLTGSVGQAGESTFKVFQNLPIDLPGQSGNKVRHYEYHENGKEYVSGTGFTTKRRMMLRPEPNKSTISNDDRIKFKEAKYLYATGRGEISGLFQKLGLDTVPEQDRVNYS